MGIQVVPFLGLGMLASIFGYQLIYLIPNDTGIFLQVAFLALLFGMVILDTEPGWNMILFLAFGLAAGMMIRRSGADISQLRTWVLFSIVMLISITGGFFSKRDTGPAVGILFLCAFLYMIGLFLYLITSLPEIVRTIWNVLGLILFTLIAITVISQEKSQKTEGMPIAFSIQLYVALFNLFWLSSSL